MTDDIVLMFAGWWTLLCWDSESLSFCE